MAKTAGVLVIGNEILSGRTRDANTGYFLKELRELGVAVEMVSIIPDQMSVVRDEVRRFSSWFDFVFTSGGVGPTHDDVTIAGIAAAFDQGIRRDPRLVTALRRYYQDALTDAMLRMADVPECAVLLGEEETLFPVVSVRNVFVFPGVPEILSSKFERIKERFRDAPYHVLDVFVQAEEGEVAEILDETLELFPEIALGSYPSFNDPEYKVKLTLESKDAGYLERAHGCLIEKLQLRSIVPLAR